MDKNLEVLSNAIGEAVGEAVGELGLAGRVIVSALREQPGFDSEKFDSMLQSFIDAPDLPDNSAALLKAVLNHSR